MFVTVDCDSDELELELELEPEGIDCLDEDDLLAGITSLLVLTMTLVSFELTIRATGAWVTVYRPPSLNTSTIVLYGKNSL